MRREAELDLATLLKALDRMQSSFAVYDDSFQLLYANAAARDAWPTHYAELEKGRSQLDAVKAEIRELFPDLPNDNVANFAAFAVEAQRTGEVREIHARGGRIFRTHHEKVGDKGIVALGIDLTDLKAHQKKLQKLASENYKLANRDALTRLPNRRHFMSNIDELIDVQSGDVAEFTLGLIDLDGFKLVNDVYGHPTGDEMLRQTASRLQSILVTDVLLARLGGDEFGIVLKGRFSKPEIEKLGRDICADLARAYQLGTERVAVAACVGFASFPAAGDSRSVLFKRADFALYHAKQNGKGQAVVFSSEHELDIRNQAQLALRIREADLESELYVAFQPIFNAETKRAVGVEALARWHNPTLGYVSPAQFIPIAEQTGQMTRLTPVLMRKALRTARDWPDPIFLSINLSALEVTSIDYALELLAIIEASGFPAERLVLEITETAMIRDTQGVSQILDLWRDTGIRIALDDFGTGFSSLNHISRMPLDILKVDRAFLDDIEQRDASSAVLRSICDLSHNLDLICIAEGVETQPQFEKVQSAGIDLMQGYMLSRPLEEDDITRFLLSQPCSSDLLLIQPQKQAVG